MKKILIILILILLTACNLPIPSPCETNASITLFYEQHHPYGGYNITIYEDRTYEARGLSADKAMVKCSKYTEEEFNKIITAMEESNFTTRDDVKGCAEMEHKAGWHEIFYDNMTRGAGNCGPGYLPNEIRELVTISP